MAYWDVDAWNRWGIPATTIFDENGQTRPGWHRTGRGYESDIYPSGPTYEGSDSPLVPGGEWGGDLGGGPAMGAFGNVPSYTSPEWLSAGDFDPGPAFSYKDFVAPDFSKIADDPAYQFRLKQGLGALGANRAGAGVFLSGATGKAMQDYGQNAASQEANNIWNRSLSEYDTNRNNAFGSWASQYGQRKDAYGFKAQDVAGHNQFNLSNARNTFDSLFGTWSKQGDWLTNLAGMGD